MRTSFPLPKRPISMCRKARRRDHRRARASTSRGAFCFSRSRQSDRVPGKFRVAVVVAPCESDFEERKQTSKPSIVRCSDSGEEPQKREPYNMKAPEGAPGTEGAASLALRAFFVYFRRGSGDSDALSQLNELTLFLPKGRGSGTLQVEGEDVPGETSLQLRREKSGVYVTMVSLCFTGALSFEVGLRTGAEEQRWLIGELRHYDGDGGGGWGMRVCTTALPGANILRDICADIEVLVCCDVAPGTPACLSAHAQLPTARRTSLRSRGRRPSSLEVITEDEKVSLRAIRRPRPLWPAKELGIC